MWQLTLFEIVRYIVAFFVIITLLKNITFLIIAPFYPIIEKRRYLKYLVSAPARQRRLDQSPKVSIIVPAWNEEVGIIKTISSVIQNGYIEYELIIVNDGPTDRTSEICEQYVRKLYGMGLITLHNIKVINQANGGKGAALNTGLSRATGEIVLTLDADSALKPGALENLVRYYHDDKIMAVVGSVEVSNTKTLVGFAQQLEYYFGFYNKRAHAVLGAEYIFGGACASFRRSVFDTVGVFDTKNKTEDIEMSMRIRAAGFKCTYAEDVVCYTEGASDIKSLISQRVRWKKGRLDTFVKYKRLFYSTADEHNFFLTFFILPFSLLTEIQLAFEPIAIAILITYSFITGEFLSLAIGITSIFLVYVIVSLFHNTHPRPGLVLLFPFTWPLFYLLDWIEWLEIGRASCRERV